MHYAVAVQEVSTVTVGPTGGSEDVQSFSACQSNQPFMNLSISVVPLEENSPYKVEILHGDEVFESHDYTSPTSRTVALFSYSHFIFPANLSLDTTAKFSDTKKNPAGVEVGIRISNYAHTQKVYSVYACYEVFEAPRFLNNEVP